MPAGGLFAKAAQAVPSRGGQPNSLFCSRMGVWCSMAGPALSKHLRCWFNCGGAGCGYNVQPAPECLMISPSWETLSVLGLRPEATARKPRTHSSAFPIAHIAGLPTNRCSYYDLMSRPTGSSQGSCYETSSPVAKCFLLPGHVTRGGERRAGRVAADFWRWVFFPAVVLGHGDL